MPSRPVPHYALPTISSQTAARAATRAVVTSSTKVKKQVTRPAKALPRPPPSVLPSAATKTTFSARQRVAATPKPAVVAAVPRHPVATAPRRSAVPVAPIAPAPRRPVNRPVISLLTATDRIRINKLIPAIEEEFARAREEYCGEIRRTCEHKVLHGSFSFDTSMLTELQVAESTPED